MDTTEIAIRLGAAALLGAALGLNRDLHGKPTGVRTLALVEVLFAQAITIFTFKQATTKRDALGIALIVAGVLLLIWVQ